MATSGMDALSKELHDFLCRLGEHPEQVSDKLQGYTQALLQLLTPADELLVKGRYGILGSTKESMAQLATRFNTDENTVEAMPKENSHHAGMAGHQSTDATQSHPIEIGSRRQTGRPLPTN